MLPQEIIRRKRDKQELTQEQINEFISGISNKSVSDVQVAAFTMAALLNGLNNQETIYLTLAMRDSGAKMEWQGFDKPVVDKHSSGGVGDKVSLMLAPILAACDVYVPMIAGRGLGHTGGTVDKLESIPDYNTQADNSLFRQTVKNVGCAIIGQTSALAPADKKIYAIRDICATVESIPLITSSILSKKLAAGLQYLVMDLKCGNGAFMNNFDDAKALAQSIVNVANGAGTQTRAVLTDMNQVLGTTVGNALEVIEAVQYLQNKNTDSRLDIITRTLCKTLLVECKRCKNENEASSLIEKVLNSGEALEKFSSMVKSLGGPSDFADNYEKYLPHSTYQKPIFADKSGYISEMDTRAVGISIIEMKGGRTAPEQKLDLATGYTEFAQIGDYVDNQKPLAIVHYQSEEQYEKAKKSLLAAIKITEDKPEIKNPILLKI
ncbi:MAG: thymidine phosphorylase [Alphaproteobacteria bacterium]|nr:thymidine phosphorylase [Alphaproteobacteria bacterium]